MGEVHINSNGPVPNGLAELNHHMRDEHKEVRDGVTGEGQGLSEEDESQINENGEDVNDGWMEAVQGQVSPKAVQQRLQGPVVCWERFLPFRSLKVLLVESDDSTRCIVCALLRNCGYEVIAVENGLQAWKILEDLTNEIDLVLTEVVMPCLSGIGLLHKIKGHKTCKNIPVIMMSSHDSMNIVFKCLSKGAVYFLVKPIRKNELQNLWQHVWRKCHSSSGSGSESGVMNQKATELKSAEESDNNSGSNDEDDIGSSVFNILDGSDNGSGTQSSWTKRPVDTDIPKVMSPWEQLANPLDSTCAQVIHSRPEAFANNWVPMTTTKECKGKDDELDRTESESLENVVMGQDLEIGVPRIPNLQLEQPTENGPNTIASINKVKSSEMDYEQLKKKQLKHNSEQPNDDLRNQAADLVGAITTNNDTPIETVVRDIPNGLFKVSGMKGRPIYDNNKIPSLELSLKRLRDVGDTGNSLHDRNVLRHSDMHSAFLRYSSASTVDQAPTGNVGSRSPLDNSSEAGKTEWMQNFQANQNSMPPSQHSNGSSNNSEMGLTTYSAVTATKECKGKDEELGCTELQSLEHVVMGHDLEIRVPRIPNMQLEQPTENGPNTIAGIKKAKSSEMDYKEDYEHLEKNQLELNSEKPNDNWRNQTANLVGAIINHNDSPIEAVGFDIPNALSKVSGMKEKPIYDNNEVPSLELSLKRLRDVGDARNSLHDRNVLRHSDLHSAFSRYSSASTVNQAPTGNVGGCSPLDNSSEGAKTEPIQNFQANPNSMPPSQRSTSSSNTMGVTTNSAFTKPTAFSKKPAPKSTVKYLHPSSTFQPTQNGHISVPLPRTQGKADAAITKTILTQVRGMDEQVQVQYYHCHYHHYYHHVHKMPQQQLANDDLLLKNMAPTTSQCGSSNVFSVPIEGNPGNQSSNGSTSGSNHGSNGQNGSSTTLNVGGANTESDTGVAIKGGAACVIGYGSRCGVEKNRFVQREAALNKFRLKRKERCFEKKVRYHSRKKLAEQRQRVRGQFVRRAVFEKEEKGTES